MQSQLLVGPVSPINGSDAFSSIVTSSFLISSPLGSGATPTTRCSRNRSSHRRLVVASSSSAEAAAVNGEPDHYKVLGVGRSASSADIKRAYRLLARKYHPDVSKESRAAEIFKTIRSAYEVLSDEVTRTKYDQTLKFGAANGRSYSGNRSYSTDFDDRTRIYKWAELRRKMKYERYGKDYYSEEKNSAFYGKTSGWEVEEENLGVKRGSFSAVLKSAFIYLFLLMVFGSQLSLTFSSLMALLDEELDGGYKIGYSIAWILGGRGGVLLTLCLSFASWVCGKTSSDAVVLVVLAMWVGSSLARYAPVPQGALIALLCMSLKLQTDTT